MDRRRKIFRWAAIVLFLMILCVPVLLLLSRVSTSEAPGAISDRRSALRLVLETKKGVYRAGEPIHIIGRLENSSDDRTFYIGRDLGGFCSILSFHYIELQITDKNRRRIPIANSSGAAVWKEGTTQRDKIEQEYVVLGPKAEYELKDTCEIRLKKGRYRMRAIYHEFEATDWKSKESLEFPVWTKTLYSNVVTITVNP